MNCFLKVNKRIALITALMLLVSILFSHSIANASKVVANYTIIVKEVDQTGSILGMRTISNPVTGGRGFGIYTFYYPSSFNAYSGYSLGGFYISQSPILEKSYLYTTDITMKNFANSTYYCYALYYYDNKKFNCYSYAFGYNDRWLHPGGGRFDLISAPYSSIGDIITLVKKDFGSKVREVTKNEILRPGEYRIAVRFSGTEIALKNDFHFWKQDPNTLYWYQKGGSGPITCLGNVNPDYRYQVGWVRDTYRIENEYVTAFYLNPTVYLAYTGDFWP